MLCSFDPFLAFVQKGRRNAAIATWSDILDVVTVFELFFSSSKS